MADRKIIITGGAGLIGQNLIPRLIKAGFSMITAIDKHRANATILEKQQPSVHVVRADLAADDGWQDALKGCAALVIGHAQIGGVDADEFVRNNIVATERLLDAAIANGVPYIVHISSSVVNSVAVNNYTSTKKAQEALVAASEIKHVVLRPTLMFGWFDRKHLGWLARFMARVPVFPIPGSGNYIRQPLYAGDFCNIIVSAIQSQITGNFNISGQEKINYIDLIKAVKEASRSKAHIQRIPYGVFRLLLQTTAIIDKDPPFTITQLEALVIPETFEVIDWPTIFGVPATPLTQALEATFRDPVYSKIVLEF